MRGNAVIYFHVVEEVQVAPRVLRVILFRFSRIPVPVTRALAQWILIEQE